MRISLDGGVIYQEAPQGVLIIVDVESDNQYFATPAEVHFNFTNEGQIVDVINEAGQVIATTSEMFDEIAVRMADETI